MAAGQMSGPFKASYWLRTPQQDADRKRHEVNRLGARLEAERRELAALEDRATRWAAWMKRNG